ncbi:MAG: hypothetical protein ACK5O7_01490 [Holosporales bacterium]
MSREDKKCFSGVCFLVLFVVLAAFTSGCGIRERMLADMDKATRSFTIPAKPSPGKTMIYFIHLAGLPEVDAFIAPATEEKWDLQEAGMLSLKRIITLGLAQETPDEKRKKVASLVHQNYLHLELEPGVYQLSQRIRDPQVHVVPTNGVKYVKLQENETYFYAYRAVTKQTQYTSWVEVELSEMKDMPEVKYYLMKGKDITKD